MRKTLIVLSCFAALLTTACTGDSSRPVATGEGNIRAINAIPTSPPVLFMIEERSVSTVDYAVSSSQLQFDDLDYVFNFEINLPDQALRERIASVPQKIEKDREYTFVITGDLLTPTIIVWDDVIREWGETETVFQMRFAHTAESLGPVDVYFAAPGTPPVAGQEAGTLSFGELLPAIDYTVGDYEYVVTTAGNPGDILFTSATLSPPATTGLTITIFDSTANNPGPLAVRVLTDSGVMSSLSDINVSPTARFIHASASLGTADIYVDDMLTDQILANHAFRDVSADLDIEAGAIPLTYTAAGNTGAILLEGTASIFADTRSQIYVVGEAGTESIFQQIADRRSVETQVKFTLTHAAFNHPNVDFYIVEAGTDIEDEIPRFFNLQPGQLPAITNVDDGDLEMYITVFGEKTIIEGPIAITTAYGDVLEYITYDNVDPATLDFVLIPLP